MKKKIISLFTKKIYLLLILVGYSNMFSQVTLTASFPEEVSTNADFQAEIIISKGSISNFAKYQMDVPSGYLVSSIETVGGNFTFENQKAKIVWVSIPSESEFTVKFNIQATETAISPGTFSHKFYFIENTEKKEIEGTPSTVKINGSDVKPQNTVEPVTSSTVAVESNTVAAPQRVVLQSIESQAFENSDPSEQIVVTSVTGKTLTTIANSKTDKKDNNSKSKTTATENNTASKTTVSIGVVEPGMTFKVQIGAFSTEPKKSKFRGVSKVSIDLINGAYKVTAGNFNTREDAVKYRDELISKGFEGFIVKFKDGQRIN